jgi:cardiolipin synthase
MDAGSKEKALADLSNGRMRSDRLGLNWPTRITLSRILLVVPFVACMLDINDPSLSERTRLWLRHVAIAIYLFMAVSDGLDGLLARRSGRVTRLGALLDPVADKLLVTATCLLLISQRGHVDRFIPPTTVVVVIIGKDVLLALGFIVAYVMTSQVYIAPAFTGKLATFVQLVMGATVLLAPELSRLVPAYDGLLSMLWWSAAATAVVATVVYIRDGCRYIGQCERAHAKGAEMIVN